MIALRGPTETLYRPHGKHDYAPGTGRTVQIVKVSVRRPYRRRPAAVTNVCGKFTSCFYHIGREPILVAHEGFGGHKHMHHVDGLMQVHGPQVHFKGAQDTDGVERLAAAAGLLDASCLVYMCVCNLEVGKGIHTAQGSCLLDRLCMQIDGCKPVRQMYYNNLHLLLKVDAFGQAGQPAFPPGAVPSAADLQVSHYGGLAVRITWAHGCAWGRPVEAAALAFSQWVGDTMEECC